MLGRLYEGQDCSAARALELVGERWSLLILRDAMFRNYTRFLQFQRSLGVAPNILATRLESFVESGLMKRRMVKGSTEQPEYLLTRKGMELKPAIMALTQWGDKWVRPGPVTFHRPDGQQVEVQLRAGRGNAVDPADVEARKR